MLPGNGGPGSAGPGPAADGDSGGPAMRASAAADKGTGAAAPAPPLAEDKAEGAWEGVRLLLPVRPSRDRGASFGKAAPGRKCLSAASRSCHSARKRSWLSRISWRKLPANSERTGGASS